MKRATNISQVKKQYLISPFITIFNENINILLGVQKIEYRPDGPNDDLLRYRYYNATERLQGRSMEDWLRPTLCLSRGFSLNNKKVIKPWTQYPQTLENYKRSIRAAFELCIKLGKYDLHQRIY